MLIACEPGWIEIALPANAVVATVRFTVRVGTPATAQTLNTMMQQVVKAGTGTAAALVGIQVAGKTGTAQKGSSNVAWFIAFAPAVGAKVAVAVTIENTQFTGGDVAAPLAAQVIKAALAQPSLP